MALNYFVCTLGQAALPEVRKRRFETVNDLVDYQSEENGDLPAIGFAYPGSEVQEPQDQTTRIYTFRDVKAGSMRVASQLVKTLGPTSPSSDSTIALLSPSTPEFLFTWLALIRLGHAVLLVAPQNHPEAVAHLCTTCNVQILLFDEMYGELATESVHAAQNSKAEHLTALKLTAISNINISTESEPNGDINDLHRQRNPSDTAYLFHTSGTSSGLPKPIPQTHRGAVGALPSLIEGRESATYSTTPLYHGGIADVFRAWSSDALIWLYPGMSDCQPKRILPITASNVLTSIGKIHTHRQVAPPIRYFSSVPYVLQMMAASDDGLQFLQSMDCVGVGGAALSTNVGNDLVAANVNLVSRYGSAECGFLLCSHREYESDKEWQYLRAEKGAENITFEPYGDNRFELVVRPGWPHMAKHNRSDGSYATSDLLTPHPSIPNAWRYDSRADSQLTLVTGKKFDPAPLESDIASSELLDDAYVFGNGQPFPGALLFRSQASQDIGDEEFIEKLASLIESLNIKSQSHARLPRKMLVPVPYGHNRLQKSSKGTILRKHAEETYSETISMAYSRLGSSTTKEVVDSDVGKAIHESVRAIIGSDVDTGYDLFAHGMDSVGSIQIRHSLQTLVPKDFGDIPMTIVEDNATIQRLTEFVLGARHGRKYPANHEDELQLMRDLVEKYCDFPLTVSSGPVTTSQDGSNLQNGATVILTGATGALGAHLLAQYLASPGVVKIYCLVRGADAHAARCRVDKALQNRKLPRLSSLSHRETPANTTKDANNHEEKIAILPCHLDHPHLGLTDKDYLTLQNTSTHIIHAAWAVNFRWRLRSFERDHLRGLRHLLALSLASPQPQKPTFVFCSSIASVVATATPPQTHDTHVLVPETPSTHPSDASPLGYSRSKWVAEAICARAAQAYPDAPIAIARIGQLAGDTLHGIWNTSEAWPLLLGSVRATGCLPDLHDPLDWLAVDTAASAVRDVAASTHKEAGYRRAAAVAHILNAHPTPTFSNALQWLKKRGADFAIVPPAEWIRALERLEQRRGDHPALRLLGLWRERYASPSGADATRRVRVETGNAERLAPVLKGVGPVDDVFFWKLWEWVQRNFEE